MTAKSKANHVDSLKGNLDQVRIIQPRLFDFKTIHLSPAMRASSNASESEIYSAAEACYLCNGFFINLPIVAFQFMNITEDGDVHHYSIFNGTLQYLAFEKALTFRPFIDLQFTAVELVYNSKTASALQINEMPLKRQIVHFRAKDYYIP